MATAPVVVPDPGDRPRRSAMRLAGRSRYPDVYYDRPINNSHVVREPDVAGRRKCYRVFASCAAALAVIFGIVLLHSECMRYGYEISQLEAQRAELKEANQQLRLEQARLADPERIDQLARQDLGLSPSSPQQFVRLGEAGVEPVVPGDGPVMARNYGTLARAERGVPREP